mmetsp:Transcript_51604/g.130508  ORF Transcript_51604/g.130508 Transcript_51604/m.130508 type:complete len:86 (-) Transcript_51604:662-919(-)
MRELQEKLCPLRLQMVLQFAAESSSLVVLVLGRFEVEEEEEVWVVVWVLVEVAELVDVLLVGQPLPSSSQHHSCLCSDHCVCQSL